MYRYFCQSVPMYAIYLYMYMVNMCVPEIKQSVTQTKQKKNINIILIVKCKNICMSTIFIYINTLYLYNIIIILYVLNYM